MTATTWWATCKCKGADALPVSFSGPRGTAIECRECGARWSEVDNAAEDAIRENERANNKDAAIMRAALVRLSTEVLYSPRDHTGEASTARIQRIAAKALRGVIDGSKT